jgi:periplasmic copper chaperone A
MTARRTAARLLAAPAAAGVALVSLAGPASAHVTITPTKTAAGAYTVLTVSVPHGCDGSATTEVAIQIPEDILSVTPTRNPLWDVAERKEKLDVPVTDAHGNKVTERDAGVVYTARTPLPDGYRDAFELSLKLPKEEGKTLVFPAIQTCEKGQTAWAEVASEGQNPEELEHPAPTLSITAAEEESEAAGTAAAAAGASGGAAEASDGAADEDSNTLGAVGLGVGVLGLLAGGTALVQVRRRG